MKKHNFEKIINGIIAQIEREREFEKALYPFFDGHLISEISTCFIESILDILEDELDDPDRNSKHGSMIRWWLFDAPEAGKRMDFAYIVLPGGVRFPLETAGQLYDYLCEVKK